jgi:predicted DNA-binding protein
VSDAAPAGSSRQRPQLLPSKFIQSSNDWMNFVKRNFHRFAIGYFDIVFLYVIIRYGKKDQWRDFMKKVAIQIYLDPEQNRVISKLSKAKGKSKTALIRSCIERFIADIPLEEDPALGVMGLGASGKKDISERHDEMLGQGRR